MRRLTIGRVVLLLPVTAIVIAGRRPLRDNSFLWHTKAGQLQIEQGAVLTADPFSFTKGGEAWRTQSWLADLLYGYFDSLSPLAAAPWMTAAAGAAIVYFAALRAYRPARSAFATGLVALVVMWVSLGWFSPRPVVFSLALLAVLLVAADDPRLRWSLPLLIWVWASVHGSFVIALGYLLLRVLSRSGISWRAHLLPSLAAANLTAHGWGVWEVLVDFLRAQQALADIIEWAVPDFYGLALAPFLLVIVALLVGAIGGRLRYRDLWVVAPFLLFAFSSSRAVPIATLVLVPWIAGAWALPSTLGERGSPPLLGAVVAVIVLVPFLLPMRGGLDPERFPLGAAQHLRSDRVFHDDGTGGYLIYAQHPERRVFIDDRAELYRDLFVEFGLARQAAPGWREFLAFWEIDEALLRPSDPLYGALKDAGWRERYADDHFVVVVRS